MVMVKKSNGYTNLNKACPKDLYPLPSINALVDGAFGCNQLSFMHTYSGYNQIRMHPSDESKTMFITDKGNFCYRGMSFSLKNARATYQRLMNHIFKDHTDNQLEVYVDNMVVKSTMETGHVENLASVFRVLRRYQLKLNPKKCSFEVKARKFLGFMLTRRGIEANPKKCNTIIDMRSHRSVKEVQ
ncbi:Retrovirus-related Pol polyprotein from transposon opus, partial [Mucuna pruriens]